MAFFAARVSPDRANSIRIMQGEKLDVRGTGHFTRTVANSWLSDRLLPVMTVIGLIAHHRHNRVRWFCRPHHGQDDVQRSLIGLLALRGDIEQLTHEPIEEVAISYAKCRATAKLAGQRQVGWPVWPASEWA